MSGSDDLERVLHKELSAQNTAPPPIDECYRRMRALLPAAEASGG